MHGGGQQTPHFIGMSAKRSLGHPKSLRFGIGIRATHSTLASASVAGKSKLHTVTMATEPAATSDVVAEEGRSQTAAHLSLVQLDQRIASAILSAQASSALGDSNQSSRKPSIFGKEKETWNSLFSDSTYALIYICPRCSQGWWYGIFIYCLQVCTIALSLSDELDIHDTKNILKIPPPVPTVVTVAQGFAIFLALAYQSDLIEAVLKIQDGFHPEIQEKHPGATYTSWLLSVWAQLCSGVLLLITIFVLTMRAQNVLSIMLNFAALHFMYEIDELGFRLARLGFITDQVQDDALMVGSIKVHKRPRKNLVRKLLYFLTLWCLFSWYVVIKLAQLRGDYDDEKAQQVRV